MAKSALAWKPFSASSRNQAPSATITHARLGFFLERPRSELQQETSGRHANPMPTFYMHESYFAYCTPSVLVSKSHSLVNPTQGRGPSAQPDTRGNSDDYLKEIGISTYGTLNFYAESQTAVGPECATKPTYLLRIDESFSPRHGENAGSRICVASRNRETCHQTTTSCFGLTGSINHHLMYSLVGAPGGKTYPKLERTHDVVVTPTREGSARLFACPVRKHHEIRDGYSSCGFKGAPNLSTLKKHLESASHSKDIAFVRLCRDCSDYVVDVNEWNVIHVSKACTSYDGMKWPQARGTSVNPSWLRLFEKIYPRENWLPNNGYVDDHTWRFKVAGTQTDETLALRTAQAGSDATCSDLGPAATNSILTMGNQSEINSWPQILNPNSGDTSYPFSHTSPHWMF